MTSAQIEEPPSSHKLDLIRRFLVASGIQQQIDRGKFVERFGIPGGHIYKCAAERGATFGGAVDTSLVVLRSAYEKHRHIWQEEYENHVNWEFTESELEQVVAFLEAPVGQHFLEGRWRMDAYIGTNTEELVEQIIEEAEGAIGQMSFGANGT
ncbi:MULTISPECIES: DUF2059 domain-containing protein [unclassified Sphingobium]|uniref:DUF2059 domain-containing protein n=1 Tax=unclassified Sphingobium TaxID=2611147 RepID=UPI0010F7274F|nr:MULTISPECIES: DUF2059 domain-containing protein [unclassified Sphingobium]UXC90146.1 DUF2059 domain-containing protein [Sphingobium sp. RSMS]